MGFNNKIVKQTFLRYNYIILVSVTKSPLGKLGGGFVNSFLYCASNIQGDSNYSQFLAVIDQVTRHSGPQAVPDELVLSGGFC